MSAKSGAWGVSGTFPTTDAIVEIFGIPPPFSPAHTFGVVKTIIGNRVFAMHAVRYTDPKELSLNQCVRSAVEFIRSNRTFRSKVKFAIVLAEDDRDLRGSGGRRDVARLVFFRNDEAGVG